MSKVLAHFALGAIITALLVHMFFREFQYKRTIIILGGIWGIIPDLYEPLPSGANVFHQLHGSHWANLFWFHRTMDEIEEGAGSPRIALALAGVLFLVNAITEWQENKHRRN